MTFIFGVNSSASPEVLVERHGRLADARMRQICEPLAVAVARAD